MLIMEKSPTHVGASVHRIYLCLTFNTAGKLKLSQGIHIVKTRGKVNQYISVICDWSIDFTYLWVYNGNAQI